MLWSPRDGFVYAVVEFDGTGHWGRQKNEYEAARNSDAVKHHACATAGIPIVRVLQDYAPLGRARDSPEGARDEEVAGALVVTDPARASRSRAEGTAAVRQPPISTDHPEF